MTAPQLHIGDCLDVMATLPAASVDLILCDLPYGTTACAWDAVIPFEPLWAQYRRLLKPCGTVVLTASQPFTTALIASNYEQFKYEWIWEKNRATGHVHAKNKPMKKHENVLVFSKGTTVHVTQSKTRMLYNPQGLIRLAKMQKRKGGGSDAVMSVRPSHRPTETDITGYPDSILGFASEEAHLHPTQKPVALMEYLIRTYSNRGGMVLDNCMGSGTTGVACVNTERNFIGIERDPGYFEIAKTRILDALPAPRALFDPDRLREFHKWNAAARSLQSALAVGA